MFQESLPVCYGTSGQSHKLISTNPVSFAVVEVFVRLSGVFCVGWVPKGGLPRGKIMPGSSETEPSDSSEPIYADPTSASNDEQNVMPGLAQNRGGNDAPPEPAGPPPPPNAARQGTVSVTQGLPGVSQPRYQGRPAPSGLRPAPTAPPAPRQSVGSFDQEPRRGAGFRSGVNMGALKEIVSYDPEHEGGGNPNVLDFLESVAGAAVLGNLGHDDIMRVLPMRLKGPARAFHRTFLMSRGLTPESPNLGDSWGSFQKALRDQFKKKTDTLSALQQLANCQQGDREQVRAYAHRVRVLALKTWPTLLQAQDEGTRAMATSLVYQHFQKGLRANLLEYLHLKNIPDMDTAVPDLAKKEAFDQSQRQRYGDTKVNAVASGVESPNSGEGDLSSQMNDLKLTVASYMADTNAILRGQMGAADWSTPDYTDQIACAQGAQYHYQQGDPAEANYPNEEEEMTGACVPYPEPLPSSGYEPIDCVNAAEYEPRLPQYPIIRPGFNGVRPQTGPRGGCWICGSNHLSRYCPQQYQAPRAGTTIPYRALFTPPWMREGAVGPPIRPTGQFPPGPRARFYRPPGAGPRMFGQVNSWPRSRMTHQPNHLNY